LALIDWPIVVTTGVFSLLLAGLLTATAYYLNRPVIQRAAWISSTVRTSTPRAALGKSPIAAVDRARPQHERRSSGEQQHPSSVIQEKTPEQTSSMTSTEPSTPEPAFFPASTAKSISESTKARGDLRQETPQPIPDRTANLEPAHGIESTSAQQHDSCVGEYGTTLKFAKDPAEAFRLAGEKKKLVFLLHVSGNFEDARFT
jgi:hypothetical protein